MNKNIPKITVVTVTYNAEKYIKRTIESVINQDYKNIEYIIIDGGSTDNTLNVIAQYNNHISYFISEPDDGIYDAMNKGIDVATGDWIQFLNAGDTLVDSDTLLKVSKYLTDKNDLVHGLMWRNKQERKLVAPYTSKEEPLEGSFIWHPTLFTKSKIMKSIKFNTIYKIVGDYDFFLNCLKNNYKIKLINEAIVDYLENGVSQENIILSNIEAMFAQTKFEKNHKNIYNTAISNNFISNNPNNQTLLTNLLNKLNINLIQLIENKKFILYGYGNVGITIYNNFKNQVIAIVDKNHKALSDQHKLNIYGLEKIKELEFDYIVISVLGREEEIKNELIKDYDLINKKFIKIDI